MKNINPKNYTFAALFGEQDAENKNLALAPYCLLLPCDGGRLLYNGLSKELVLLSNEETEFLKKIDSIDNETTDYLKKGWFFIPDTASGKKYCDQLFSMARILRIKEDDGCYKRYTIMTTLECNARCFYCYEKGRQQPRMTTKTAEDVASFILKHSKPEKIINISWFGGEPLYNSEVIEIISNVLKSADREYVSNMITNGYLIDDDIITKAKNIWNLKKVQISLDGTEKIYNRSKNYIYCDDVSPFKRVISNIKALLKNDIKVAIRLNLGLHNADDLYELVDFLADEFGEYKNFSVYAHRLFDYDEFGNQIHKDDEIIRTINLFNKFSEYIVSKKLNSGKELEKEYKINYCMADSKNAVVITPEGKLTKCEHFSDREIIGDIYSDKLDTKLINDWKELQPRLDICEDCAAYMDCLRLKKCPDISPRCDIYQKEQEINRLRHKIINTYDRWKPNN